MLWDAGQARQEREASERLLEAFVTGRDAQLAAWGSGRFVPRYLATRAEPEPERGPAARDRALASLASLIPGAGRRS